MKYNRETENLIEIVRAYDEVAAGFPDLTEIESLTWNQKFVDWANEFEEKNPEPEDYPYQITTFAKRKIFEFAKEQGIHVEKTYFTFGSWEKYPFRNTFLIVYGRDIHDCCDKFRKNYPDVNEGLLNCAFYYNERTWDQMSSEPNSAWCNEKPATIIY